MVSLQGTTEVYDYQYTYLIPDLRSVRNVPIVENNSQTVLGFLQNNKEFSIFYNLVVRAKLEGKLSDTNYNSTLLVAPDKSLADIDPNVFKNIDYYTARELILYNTLDKKVTESMLKSTRAQYLKTRIDKSVNSQILAEVCEDDSILLNEKVKITQPDLQRSNGLIHVTDGILVAYPFSSGGRFSLRPYVVCGY